MGARVAGAGTSTIEIDGVGVDAFHPVEHATMPDRIESGTWAAAAVATRGDITIAGARADHLDLLLGKLADAGADGRPHRGRGPGPPGRTAHAPSTS